MKKVEALKNNSILDWATILIGLENDWCSPKDASEFGAEQLLNCTAEELPIIATIAAEGTLRKDTTEEYIKNLLEIQGVLLNETSRLILKDRWLLAHLENLVNNKALSADEKIEELQELYGEFGFPEDMRECSIYNTENLVPPLDAARDAIMSLKSRLGIE